MTKNRNKCAAVNCNNRRCDSTSENYLSFHKFPKDLERCKKWIMNCGRYDLLDRPLLKLRRNYSLCGEHFEQQCYMNSLRRSLVYDAVPTIFKLIETPNLPKGTEKESTSFVNDKDVQIDLEPKKNLALFEDTFGCLPETSEFTLRLTSSPDLLETPLPLLEIPLEIEQKVNIFSEEELAENELISKQKLELNQNQTTNLDLDLTDDDLLSDTNSVEFCRLCAMPKFKKNMDLLSEDIINILTKYLSADEDKEITTELSKYACNLCIRKLRISHRAIDSFVQADQFLRSLIKSKFDPSNFFNNYYNGYDENEITLSENNITYVPDISKSSSTETAPKVNYDFCGSWKKCDNCSLIFTSKIKKKQHEKDCPNSTKNRINSGFVCQYCGKHFDYARLLDEHLRIHTNEKPFICEYCGKTFRLKQHLTNHYTVHSNKIFTCPVCKKSFKHKSYFYFHKRTHAGLQNELQVEEKEATDLSICCQVCDKTFTAKSLLRDHMLTHTGEKPFICRHCNKGFRTNRNLKKHLECHQNRKRFKCSICLKAFTTNGNAKRHFNLHREKCCCIICHENFPTVELAIQHRSQNHTEEEIIEAHRNKKLFKSKCKFCDEIVPYKMLAKHLRTNHKDYKPWVCNFCSKGFMSKEQLNVHERVHTNERPFLCNCCPSRFKTRSTLKWHILSKHENIWPFSCPYCERKFKRLHTLIVHKRTHTGEKPYPCSVCGRPFANKSDMIKHTKTHLKDQELIARSISLEIPTNTPTKLVTQTENEPESQTPTSPKKLIQAIGIDTVELDLADLLPLNVPFIEEVTIR